MTPEEESNLIVKARDLELENVRISNELEWARKALADVHSGKVYTQLLAAIDYWREKRDEALGIEPKPYPYQLCPKCSGGGVEDGCDQCRGTGKFAVWLEESGRDFEAERLRQDA